MKKLLNIGMIALMAVSSFGSNLLGATVQAEGNEATGDDINVISENGDSETLTWEVTSEGESSGSVQFQAEVVQTDEDIDSVDNWDREDPYISYTVTKECDPASGSNVGFGQEITYTLVVKNTGKQPVHNIVVLDKIPDKTKFSWVDHTVGNGTYYESGNYVRYQIDELKVSEVAKLTFKAMVTSQVVGDDTDTITNHAIYNNYNNGSTIPSDDVIFDTGTKTNEVKHIVVGVKIDAVKSSSPVTGSRVQEGDIITYSVKLTNNTKATTSTSGSSYANVRLTDDIPDGTTYIDGSLGLVSDNTDSNQKYAVSKGANFDVRYIYNGSYFKLENIADLSLSSNYTDIEITVPTGLTITAPSLPSGWSTISSATTKLRVRTSKGISQSAVKSYLGNIKFKGTYGTVGSISVKTYDYNTWTTPEQNITYNSGSDFKYSYDANNQGVYTLNNITVNAETVDKITVNYAHETMDDGAKRMTVNASGINTSVWNVSLGDGVVTLTAKNKNATKSQVYSALSSLSWTMNEILLASGAGNTVSADNTHNKELNNAVPNGYYVKVFKVTKNTDNSSNKKAHVDFGSISADFTDNLVYYNYGNYINMSGQKSHIYTYAQGDGKYKNVKLYLTAYKTSADEELISVGMTGKKEAQTYENTTDLKTVSGTLPTPSNSGGCVYRTDNGKPYVECVSDNLKPTQSLTMTFKVKVQKNTDNRDKIVNVAKYENSFSDYGFAGTLKTKPTKETNETVHYLKGLSVSATKSADPVSGTTVSKGQEIKYTIAVTNTSELTADYVHVRDYIPEHTSYAGSISDGGAYVSSGNYVEWVVKDLAKGQTKYVTFTVRVNDNTTSADTIYNTALYELKTNDPGEPGTIDGDPKDKSNQTVHPLANRDNPDEVSSSVSKTANPVTESYVHRQDEIEYTLTVQNLGTGLQDFVLVEDKIPEGTTFKEIKAYTGGTNSSTLSVRSYYNETEEAVKYVVCDLANLDSVELHFAVTVDKECMVDEIDNQAKYRPLRYSSTSADTDKIEELNLTDKDVVDFPSIYNDGKAKETEVTKHYLYQPNVTVRKSSDPESDNVVARGSTIEYTLTVKNDGKDVANYVNVEDIIPNYVTYVQSSLNTTKDTDKVATVTNATDDVTAIQAVLYDLQVGEERTIKFKVTVNQNAPSGIFIDNIATYGNSEKEKGEPGKDTFVTPEKETNEVIHTVELTDDLILTGGSGWNNYLPFVGGGVLVLALAIFLITKKERR